MPFTRKTRVLPIDAPADGVAAAVAAAEAQQGKRSTQQEQDDKARLAAAAALERLEELRDPAWNPEENSDMSDDDDEDDDADSDDGENVKQSSSSRRPLLWQLDPQESFSDWTIYISTAAQEGGETTKPQEEEENDDVYHVHRNMLTCGLVSSHYFRMLFQSDAFSEAQTSSSRIALVEPARKAFPLFLNLLYHPTSDLKDVEQILEDKDIFNNNNNNEDNSNDSMANAASNKTLLYSDHLVSLLHLADFFQVTTLHKLVMKVIQNPRRIPFHGFTELYKQATSYSPPISCVLEYMQDYCAKNILSLSFDLANDSASSLLEYLQDYCASAAIVFSYYTSSSSSSISSRLFWKTVNVEFVLHVVSSELHLRPDPTIGLVTSPEISRGLSNLVANYCMHYYDESNKYQIDQKQSSMVATTMMQHHNNDSSNNNKDTDMIDHVKMDSPLDAETFRILVQKDYLPTISFDAAKKLLQLEKLFLQQQHFYNDQTAAVAASNSHDNNNNDNKNNNNDDANNANLTCLQKRCLDALIDTPRKISINSSSSPGDDDGIIQMLKTSTLLSVPAIVDFMSRLCNKQIEMEKKRTAAQLERNACLERELKRFQLLPAREVTGNDDDEINKSSSSRACCGRIKPVYSCAPQKYLPKHLHNGRDHRVSGGGSGRGGHHGHRHRWWPCPGHVLSKDRKRVLFTYNAEAEAADSSDEEEEEEEELPDSSEQDSENDDNEDDDEEGDDGDEQEENALDENDAEDDEDEDDEEEAFDEDDDDDDDDASAVY